MTIHKRVLHLLALAISVILLFTITSFIKTGLALTLVITLLLIMFVKAECTTTDELIIHFLDFYKGKTDEAS